MNRALFLAAATVILAACDRPDPSPTGSGGGAAVVAPAPITGEMPQATPGVEMDVALQEKARSLAKEDPVGGLRWLFSKGLVAESGACLSAYLDLLAKERSPAMLDLADLIESPQVRAAYQSAAYEVLANQDSALAWRLWTERSATHPDEPVRPMVLHQFRNEGFRQAWDELQRRKPGSSLDLAAFRTILGSEKLSQDDAAFAVTLLRNLSDGSGKELLTEPKIVETLCRLDLSGLGDWLVSLPTDPRYDPAFSAMAADSAGKHDFTAAQSWLERIQSPDQREATLACVRDHMSSTLADSKPKVD
ncbi:hypothetical protein KBB96_02570 [Luteolibacter ambystomatis]|uniref:Uncharacterized protein n=1 Tax=Luteolibacter ambystomatis TaxID=2824561 RepID=A0A975J0J0_9BACT|nr:hypothetical protein [Luteolibacter ambystomatis]QUE51782.1 hypothetical protein KBB96_02570 [Luteolibacter ambystomatis]